MNNKYEQVGDFEYFTGNLIGHGAFACVYKGRKREKHSVVVAIKSITKKNLSKSQNLLGKEIKILKELTRLHHDNVVALLDCKETPSHVFLVMEYCNGGDLADYLQAKGTLSEDTIRLFLRQLAEAMSALNGMGVVHRDLKPQNILLCHALNKTNPAPHEILLKIADFGFARFLQDGVMAATLCGSPMYMAPEVIMSLQYDAKADLWSIGTIVFQCLTGKAPFQAQTPQALKLYYEKNVHLTPKISSGTSPELTDLLVKLLKRNAKDRLDFDDFFRHPFLKKISKPSSPVPVPARQHSLPREISPAFKTISASPSSANTCPYSPPDICEEDLSSDVMSLATPKSPSYNQLRYISNKDQSLNSSIEGPDDFVIVSPNIPSDNSPIETTGAGMGMLKRKSAEIFGSSPMLIGTPTKMSSSPSSGILHNTKRFSAPADSPSPKSTYMPVAASPCPVTTGAIGIPSQPIPVPSQKLAYQQIEQSLQESPVSRTPNSMPSAQATANSNSNSPKAARQNQWENYPAHNTNNSVPRSPPIGLRQNSFDSAGRITPDLASLSPPSVQFMIGTPPLVGRRTSFGSANSSTPPVSPWSCGTSPFLQGHKASSPARKNIASSNSNYFFGANYGSKLVSENPVSPIRYSPTSASSGFVCNPLSINLTTPNQNNAGMISPSFPLVVPFGNRDSTDLNLMDTNGSSAFIQRSGSSGKINDALNGFQNIFSNPPLQGAGEGLVCHSLMPYSRQSGGLVFDCEMYCGSSGRGFYSGGHDGSTCKEAAGSTHYQFSNSPNMEGQVFFVAPELPEETIMDKVHNEILAKLNFVFALVDCIIELAKTRSTPLATLNESTTHRDSKNNPLESQVSVVSESCRRAEQLVLYFRALQMLSASLNLSREELKAGRLQPSSCVKNVVTHMNKKYHHCLQMCKSLNSQNLLQAATSDPRAAAITADKLLYNYAIEMCQSAAMEELFGQPQVCFRSYQTAQILLHSLAQQINNENDRYRLNKYKDAVEKRLYILQQQGYVYAYDTSVT